MPCTNLKRVQFKFLINKIGSRVYMREIKNSIGAVPRRAWNRAWDQAYRSEEYIAVKAGLISHATLEFDVEL